MPECSDKGQIQRGLAMLAEQSGRRSKTGQLRGLLPSITQAQAEGVSNRQIVELLANYGLVMSLSTFQSLLCRIRRETIKLPRSSSTKRLKADAHPLVRAPPRPSTVPEAEGMARSEFLALRKHKDFDPDEV